MINRDNYLLMKEFLEYRRLFDQISPASQRLEESWLRHLLEWADERSFAEAPKIRPPFPVYLLESRRDGQDKPLSNAYVTKITRAAKRFFRWLPKHQAGYGALTAAYIDTLKPPRTPEQPKERQAVTLEEVQAIAEVETLNLRQQRIQAAAVFLFLSGIRVGAFTTLTLETVDLDALTIKQWPSKGVRTKNSKHATTYLLNIPELLPVVREWDELVRAHLGARSLWFAPLSASTGELDPDVTIDNVGRYRHTHVRKDLKELCELTGLPYYSPHKFRHGHATYSLKQADTVADLKAISQNLMHASLKTTDEIYAVLDEDSVQARIAGLGRAKEGPQMSLNSNGDMAAMLRSLAAQLDSAK